MVLVASIVICVGIGILIYAIRKDAHAKDPNINWVLTEATITEVEKRVSRDSDGSRSVSYTAYILYTVDGEDFSRTSPFSHEGMKAGDILRIYYNSADPKDIRTEAGTEIKIIYLIAIIFIIFGGIGLIVSLFWYIPGLVGKMILDSPSFILVD